MNPAAAVTYFADSDRIGWITFDDPTARANLFNPATEAALGWALDAVDADRPRAVVIISAKDRIFIAGADLKQLAALPDVTAAAEFSRRGQRLFQRIADLPVPVVCAIHGACAGGGFELALACHWRIASDAPVTQIGLPEISIGAIPGWGGCVRLPRLVGVKPALDHIVKAQLISSEAARGIGMIHEVVPVSELKARARLAALKLATEGPPVSPPLPALPKEEVAAIRTRVQARFGLHQPAPLAAMEAIIETAEQSVEDALRGEARCFGQVTAGEICKNLIHVFFLREAAKKRTLAGWFEQPGAGKSGTTNQVKSDDAAAGLVKRVGVIGAGVMGSGIAHWLASRGFEVALRDVQPEMLARGLEVVRRLLDEAVERGKMSAGEANSALHCISTTTAWEGFEACDLVVEAIVENTAAKQALFREIEAIVRPDTVLASNTSALPIEEIAGQIERPQRTIGIHFFNPVSRLPLVELIISPQTSVETAERALALVKALGKLPVICRSSPGFLVTRVLFFYLNAAVRLWEEGMSTVTIDAGLREFGWPMGPMRLIDEVGVDVTDFIFGELAHYFPDRFVRSRACGRLLAAGLRGRKNGASRGFYRYEGKNEVLNDEETRLLWRADNTLSSQETADVTSKEHVSRNLMRVMVGEAQRCLDEGVVKTPEDVDFALLSGAGFPAFRGGLMRWAHQQ